MLVPGCRLLFLYDYLITYYSIGVDCHNITKGKKLSGTQVSIDFVPII